MSYPDAAAAAGTAAAASAAAIVFTTTNVVIASMAAAEAAAAAVAAALAAALGVASVSEEKNYWILNLIIKLFGFCHFIFAHGCGIVWRTN